MAPEKLLEKTFENLGDAVLIVDSETHLILRCNPAVARIFGYSPDELIGLTTELLHADRDQYEIFGKTFEAACDATGIYRGHFVMRRKDGTLFPSDHTVSEISEASGRRVAAIHVVRDLTDLFGQERRRHETRDQFRTIFEKAPTGMAAVSLDKRLLQANSAFCRTTGITRDELLGRSLLDIIHPEDRSSTSAWLREMEQEGDRTTAREKRYLRKDGEVFWGQSTACRIGGKGGQPDFFVTTIQDISERKRTEEALKESERRLQALVGSIDEIVFEFDAEGTYLNVWTANEALLFRPKAELIGRRTREVLDPDLAATGQQAITKALASGLAQTFEYPLDLPGGRRWFLARIAPIPSPAGPPRTVSFLARDITDRKQMEESLRESQRRFHDMLENIQLAAVILDMDGKVIYCNDFLLRLTGFPREEVVGRNWFDHFIPPDERDSARNVWRTMVETNSTRLHLENQILTRRGDRRLLAWNDTLLYDPEGNVMASAAIGEDITERRQAERVLRENERMKSEFISTAAHELSTPLATLLGYVEILNDPAAFGITDPEQIKEFLGEILAKGKILGDIVNDLLDLSRIEAGLPIPLRKAPHSLVQIMERLLATYQRRYPSKRFELGSWENVSDMWMDPDKIEQVVVNLLSNAAKYSSKSGWIRVTGQRTGNYYQVSVEDTGIGMTSEQAARVFEKFYRVDASNTAVGGLGLGLCIAKNIIENHSGTIWVKSAPTQGTIVSFTLPANDSKPSCEGEGSGSSQGENGRSSETDPFSG